VRCAPVVARTSSPAATRALAAAVAGLLEPGDLLLLVGELGTGKTTFVQGLAQGLGVTGPVTSPTFTLVRAYGTAGTKAGTGAAAGTGPRGAAAVRTLFHADLFRLERLSDVVDLGLAEMVEDEAVAVVEWGDVAGPVFGPDTLTVCLAADGTEDERTLRLETGGTWAARAAALAERLRPWTVGAGGDGAPPEAGAGAGGRSS